VTGSSPADLAIAFRSFPRRLDEALARAAGDPQRAAAANAAVPAVARAIGDAAAALGRSGLDGPAIATHIESMPAGSWDEVVLERVQSAALAAGRAIRAVQDAAEG
jgi:hypothetical protein